MMLLLTLRVAAALFLQDMPPQDPADEVYVCRVDANAPAGFNYELTFQIRTGDIVTAYEDMCPEAIERFNRGEGTFRPI